MDKRPSVSDLVESVVEGFDVLNITDQTTDLLYKQLRLLDDLLWNTITSLKLR
jgi:hypothetical protein